MEIITSIIIFIFYIIIGILSAAGIVLPIFYGIPKALMEFFQGKLHFKAVLKYLIPPMIWIFILGIISFLLVFYANSFAYYLLNSDAFLWGGFIGFWGLIVKAIFSSSMKRDM